MHAARKLGSLSLSGLKRRKRVRLKTIDKEAVVTHLSQYGGDFVILVVWTMLILFWSVFRHDCGVVLFLSLSITVTEWPCLMEMFYEIACV